RTLVVQAAITAHFGDNGTTEHLRKLAQRYLAFPPAEDTANQWGTKILFRALRTITHEKFATCTPSEWTDAIVMAVYSDAPLVAWPRIEPVQVVRERRDFLS